jgi:hypothetical protein
MRYRSLLIFFIFFSPSLLKAKSSATLKENTLNFSASLGLGYDSFIYYNKKEGNASESFLHFATNITYYPTSFFSLSLGLGVGFFPFYNSQNISSTQVPNFPSKVSRVLFYTGVQAEFYAHTFSDNLIYIFFGPSFYYLSQLKSSDTSASIIPTYPSSSQNILYLKVGLGDRFSLFDHTLMDVSLSFLIPTTKFKSISGNGERMYHNLGISFDVSFGYYG